MDYLKGNLYRIKLKHYPNCTTFTLTKIKKIKSFHTHTSPKPILSTDDERFPSSLSRSSTIIKDLVLSNTFDFFFTLTLKDYSFRTSSLEACEFINHSIKKYSRCAKRRGFDFKYIYVFERQQKGGIHVHGYFSGFYDLYINEYGHYSSTYFDTLGFQNFTIASAVNPFYLIKYIEKEPILELKHLYFRSRNLKLPEVSYLHDNLYEFFNFPFTFENQFCRIITVQN